MGRKQNQVVVDFFNRGKKLNDNSNRYEHTCKACGEHFPKGRVEVLITHVEKKCPVIGAKDRACATTQSTGKAQFDPNLRGGSVGLDRPILHGPAETRSTLAPESSRGLTGLEALAEASRQVEHPPRPVSSFAEQDHLIDPSLEGQFASFRRS